jgi:hypothetical protein
LNKLFRLGIVLFVISMFMVSSPASANVVCNTYTYRGDDDSAFAANLPFTLSLGATEYSNVYVSTNGTLTFGRPDGTYWDYPQTPSVSVAGYDWVSFGEGAYLSFGSTENTFCAEWSVRPFPQSTGELTQIRLVINRASDGGWHGEIVTFGWLPNNVRRGIRFEQGQPVVPMEAAFDVNGGVPVEVPPAPAPPSFTEPPVLPTPSPEPVPSIVPSLDPEPTPIPEPTQSESPSPEPTVEPSPTPTEIVAEPTPTQEVVTPVPIEPTPTPTPEVEPTPSPSPTVEELAPEITPEPQPTMAVPAPVSDVETFLAQVDIQVPTYLENVPGVVQLAQAAESIMAIGSDMTPEEREESQGVVVAAVIVSQLAQIRRLK